MAKTIQWIKDLGLKLRAWAAEQEAPPGYPLFPDEWEMIRVCEALRQCDSHTTVAQNLGLAATAHGWAVPAPKPPTT